MFEVWVESRKEGAVSILKVRIGFLKEMMRSDLILQLSNEGIVR